MASHFFDHWKMQISELPGLWCCRDVRTNQLYLNRATREQWNIPDEIISWPVASRLIHDEDLAPFEDCQSRVLKCGGCAHCLVRFRGERNEWHSVWHTVRAELDADSGSGVILVLLRAG